MTKCLNETKALVEDKNITLSWHSDVVNYIANEGYDPKYGARNIKRVIQQQIKEAPFKRNVIWVVNERWIHNGAGKK